ncbi:MAG: hypothetical protein FWB88_06850 [Defluviitaleaceae bacterium]|nr:hypothetical protein [Defluviitaleaceae bacterium]MCL2239403.1 hypothetical protein [Defluviitaleaceae bacterium]
MLERIKIAILAKSFKGKNNGKRGYCVAGITEDGDWIRLVDDTYGDSLPNRVEFEVGQIIQAQVEPAPFAYQSENAILYDYSVIEGDWNDYIARLRQPNEPYVFVNNAGYLNELQMRKINGTLRLASVNALEIYKNEGRSGCKASFMHKGKTYEDVSMTTPGFYTRDTMHVGRADIVVSLPAEKGSYTYYYKFIAAIFPV